MKTIELQQGTPEWKEWRASRFTASDAPAMLGISPYKTRAELLREKATGEAKEYNEATQARFASGHYAEERAREMLEIQIGGELFPCVGEDDDGKLAASFDGMTMNGDTIFEHKLLNNDLRRCRDEGVGLPEHYRAQMEHQLLVSGARECIFMASKWDGNGELAEKPLIVSYFSNYMMRSRILDGWKKFANDLQSWQPETASPAQEGSAPETLPALHVQVQGRVISSNLAEFKSHALAVIGNINTDPHTDEDFADAEKTVKWCKDVESRLSAAKDAALGQTASINELFRALDEIAVTARRTRLDLEKKVKEKKDKIRADKVQAAAVEYSKFCGQMMRERGFQIPVTRWNFADEIKGLKTLASIDNKLSSELAAAKSVFAAKMDCASANLEWMRAETEAAQWDSLFERDRLELLGLPAEAFRDAVIGRIAKAKAEQAAREEAQRQVVESNAQEKQAMQQGRLILHALENKDWNTVNSLLALTGQLAMLSSRCEFVHWQAPELRLRMNQNDRFLAEGILPREFESLLADRIGQPVRLCIEFPVQEAATAQATAKQEWEPVSVRAINEAIAPLSITTAGLEHFGFHPVETKGRAVLYPASVIAPLCMAAALHLQNVAKAHKV